MGENLAPHIFQFFGGVRLQNHILDASLQELSDIFNLWCSRDDDGFTAHILE